MPLFETIKTNAGTQPKNEMKAVSFGMAVAFMMFIKELRRNVGETAATAENRHQPQNIFLPFLAELYNTFQNYLSPTYFFSNNLPKHLH